MTSGKVAPAAPAAASVASGGTESGTESQLPPLMSLNDQMALMLDTMTPPQLTEVVRQLYATDAVVTALVLSLSVSGLFASTDGFDVDANLFRGSSQTFAQIYLILMMMSTTLAGLGLLYCVHAYGEIMSGAGADVHVVVRRMGLMATFAVPVLSANLSVTAMLLGCMVYVGLKAKLWAAAVSWSMLLALALVSGYFSSKPTAAKLNSLLEVRAQKQAAAAEAEAATRGRSGPGGGARGPGHGAAKGATEEGQEQEDGAGSGGHEMGGLAKRRPAALEASHESL
ncbi:hypothetical protein HXX76_004779 [Chlamydomonas incerta]|uniref:Uncharacterized protein n=1 Tax=Chlamydomonas incerta TaxID=51695 RepID=A0A835W3P2_CHLIN|nr:hypothetical protein HXX76_004779 [Chlamydomonas incerta]|eukprot:KAG2439422.1 hypothetical protein HXX76_004779 [Chlamydomonas incerta]